MESAFRDSGAAREFADARRAVAVLRPCQHLRQPGRSLGTVCFDELARALHQASAHSLGVERIGLREGTRQLFLELVAAPEQRSANAHSKTHTEQGVAGCDLDDFERQRRFLKEHALQAARLEM
jgi:hypothetical protein